MYMSTKHVADKNSLLKAQLKKAGVKVFQMHSKSHSMILNIIEPQEKVHRLK